MKSIWNSLTALRFILILNILILGLMILLLKISMNSIERMQIFTEKSNKEISIQIEKYNELQKNTLALEKSYNESQEIVKDLWKYKRTFQSLEDSGINFEGINDINSLLNRLEDAPYANPFGDEQYEISSPFGARDESTWNGNDDHIGIDLVPLTGNRDIYHVADGIVESFELNDPVFGNHMWVNHGNFKTHYAHLEYAYWQDRENKLIEGVTIKKGQLLGRMGSTGFTLGAHLHYEIWMKNDNEWILIDPSDMVEFIGMN